MRIWFTADIPSETSGGVLTSILFLSEGLRARGHEVRVITRKTIPSKNYLHFAFRLGLYFGIRFLERPDWIIARSTDAFFCLLLIRIFTMKTKTVLYNHGWEEIAAAIENRLPRKQVFHPTTWKARLVRFPLLRTAYHLSTLCISGTVYETRILQNRYSPSVKKSFYLSNGIVPGENIFWNQATDYPPFFITVGNHTWKKNLTYVESLFSRIAQTIPQARLICIGAGQTPEFFPKETTAADTQITILPVVDHSVMDLWYQTCPYMIVTPRYEGGHSLAMLEAMSHGTVVFASCIPSNIEFITHEHSGFHITGCSIDEDIKTILVAMQRKDLSDIRRYAAHAARRFRWERQVQRLETLLEKPR
jgi:glycosyltransferase involved in cell wall biosynthesis